MFIIMLVAILVICGTWVGLTSAGFLFYVVYSGLALLFSRRDAIDRPNRRQVFRSGLKWLGICLAVLACLVVLSIVLSAQISFNM